MKTQKTEMIFARVEKSLVKRLQQAARRVDRTTSWIVREAVKAELDRIEGRNGGKPRG